MTAEDLVVINKAAFLKERREIIIHLASIVWIMFKKTHLKIKNHQYQIKKVSMIKLSKIIVINYLIEIGLCFFKNLKN